MIIYDVVTLIGYIMGDIYDMSNRIGSWNPREWDGGAAGTGSMRGSRLRICCFILFLFDFSFLKFS